jgi:hypothetical protein
MQADELEDNQQHVGCIGVFADLWKADIIWSSHAVVMIWKRKMKRRIVLLTTELAQAVGDDHDGGWSFWKPQTLDSTLHCNNWPALIFLGADLDLYIYMINCPGFLSFLMFDAFGSKVD